MRFLAIAVIFFGSHDEFMMSVPSHPYVFGSRAKWSNQITDTFFQPRLCMRAPIPEIFEAAHLLDRAVGAHIAGDRDGARQLISTTNSSRIRERTEPLWGNKSDNPDQEQYHRFRECADAPPSLPKGERIEVRMPTGQEKQGIIEHHGFNCAFCGIPVIRKEVREAIRATYPDALPWGSSNPSQHAAFQCMWLQLDHLLPHSRVGAVIDQIPRIVLTFDALRMSTGETCQSHRGKGSQENEHYDSRGITEHKQ